MEDRRDLSRINLFYDAEMSIESGKKIKSSAGAINLKGVFFVGTIEAKKNENCKVSIWLSEDIKIEAKGIIRRIAEDGVGVEFVELMGPETYLHLKNIMQYNAEDQHSFLKELEAYTGIRKSNN